MPKQKHNKSKKNTSVKVTKKSMKHHPHFRNKTQIMFYSRSKDTKVGKGTSEFISKREEKNRRFKQLNKIKNWRKMLSNLYQRKPIDDQPQPLFIYNNRKWVSSEAAFQAMKFLDTHPEYYEKFTLDSGDALGKSMSEKIKQAGGDKVTKENKVVLSRKALKKWDEKKRYILSDILYAKYSQNKDLKNVLLLTKSAKLIHQVPRSPTILTEYRLMQVRYELANNKIHTNYVNKDRKIKIEEK